MAHSPAARPAQDPAIYRGFEQTRILPLNDTVHGILVDDIEFKRRRNHLPPG